MKNEHLLEGARNQSGLNAKHFAQNIEWLLDRAPWEIQLAQLNFINTNDLARFITVTDDRASVELATVLLFTLPGAPAILYGDEVGLTGGLPPDSRRGFPAENIWDRTVLEFHKELMQIRNLYAALRRGSYKTVYAENMLFLFQRQFEEEMILTAVNSGDHEDQVVLSDAQLLRYMKNQKVFGKGDLIRDSSGNYYIKIPPRSSGMFRIL
jgi:cyclomaltodextrinase